MFDDQPPCTVLSLDVYTLPVVLYTCFAACCLGVTAVLHAFLMVCSAAVYNLPQGLHTKCCCCRIPSSACMVPGAVVSLQPWPAPALPACPARWSYPSLWIQTKQVSILPALLHKCEICSSYLWSAGPHYPCYQQVIISHKHAVHWPVDYCNLY